MMLRLRQICLVAPKLEPVVEQLASVLDLEVAYRDPAVDMFGLENAILPIGDSFIEVVAPTRPGTAATRFLERHIGGGGYMVILDTDRLEPWRVQASAHGIRIAADLQADGYQGLQLHPRDTGGTLLEINWSLGWERGSYHPAGPDWQSHRKSARVRSIDAACVAAEDPAQLARRWSGLLLRPLDEHGTTSRLDRGRIEFVPKHGAAGLSAIEIAAVDADAVLKAAASYGLEHGAHHVTIGGVKIMLKSAE